MAKKKVTKKSKPDAEESVKFMLYKQANLLKGMDEYLGSINDLLENILKTNELIRARYTQYVDELKRLRDKNDAASNTDGDGSSE